MLSKHFQEFIELLDLNEVNSDICKLIDQWKSKNIKLCLINHHLASNKLTISVKRLH
jgi:hypothetical protein